LSLAALFAGGVPAQTPSFSPDRAVAGLGGTVRTFADYNGELSAGGAWFSAKGGLIRGLARFDGADWRPVGSGIGLVACSFPPADTQIAAMVEWNGELVFAGTFDRVDGQPIGHVARWDGTQSRSLGSGVSLSFDEAEVRALAVYNNELYTAGCATTAAAWSALGAGSNGPVWSTTTRNNLLVASGEFPVGAARAARGRAGARAARRHADAGHVARHRHLESGLGARREGTRRVRRDQRAAVHDPMIAAAFAPPARGLATRPRSEHNRRGPVLAPRVASVMSDSSLPIETDANVRLPDGITVAALYDEIRRLARGLMRGERNDHTLPPTALANEAYLRLFGRGAAAFANGNELLAAAVTTLRRILVEHGRRRGRLKRGGGLARSDIETDQLPAAVVDERVVQLDEAMRRLAEFDPTKARLVELRFFGGLGVDEAARVLDLSPRTAARDWRVARAFLRAELGVDPESDGLDT